MKFVYVMSRLAICLVLLMTTCIRNYDCEPEGRELLMFNFLTDFSGQLAARRKLSTPEEKEFDTEERKVINSFKDAKQRRILKKQLQNKEKKTIKKTIKNYTRRNLLSFFRCAVSGIKSMLEDRYNTVLTSDTLLNWDVPYPSDFASLNSTHDRWIDIYAVPTYNQTSNPTSKIYSAYKRWYHYLSADPIFIQGNRELLEKIQGRLKYLCSHDQKYDSNIGFVYQRCAAAMARDYQMMCTLQNNLEDRLSRRLPELTFSEALFEIVGTWYFTYEDVVFLNIILHPYEEPKSDSLIKFIVAVNKMGDRVVIPYDNSDKCGNDDIDIPLDFTTYSYY